MKKAKLYILLALILCSTIVTIALTASVLGIVVRRTYKSEANVQCDQGMLVCSISSDDLMKHLQQLQNIADECNGTRAIHTEGFNRTFDYIYSYLKTNTNLQVQTEFFPYMKFSLNGDPVLSTTINGLEMNYTYGSGNDFISLRNSGSSSLAKTFQLVSMPAFGCEDSNWLNTTSSPSGKVVLIKRGVCTFTEKSLLAARYGVAGLLIYNDGTSLDRYSPASGRVDENVIFPALSLSYQVGTKLLNTIENLKTNVFIKIHLSTSKYPEPVGNICAHTVTGNATKTIV
ncbi:unnamed protein product, partial [Adineta ricciae]